VPGIASSPLAALLDEVAAPVPAPGGGSGAACACALAAALVEMAAAISGASPPGRLSELREEALALAEAELSSYEPVLAARRLSRADAGREARLVAALEDASGPPCRVAEAAAEVAELGAGVAASAEASVAGDAVAGVLIAEAAAAAAARLVEINLSRRPEAPTARRARTAAERARGARERTEA
jgi:formiminotetrahydrofolate cyclodeaminase